MSSELSFYELPLSYPVETLPESQVQRDIVYLKEGDPVTRMDIYLPVGEAPAAGYLPVLFLHGGPLSPSAQPPWPKEWRVFQDYGRLAATNGLAGVVINTRYFGYEGLVQASADVKAALDYLAEQGAEHGVYGQRVALWIFSGAGMLLSALFQKQEAYDLSCLAAFYPMFDLTHVPQALELYNEEQLIALSPLSHLEKMAGSLPMFIARAGLDRPGLNRAIDTFVKQALYHNLDLEMRNLPRAVHGFDLFEEAAVAQETIQRGLDFVRTNLHEQ